MAIGTNLGTVYYEIEPDLDLAAFSRQAALAGAAVSRGFNQAFASGAKKLNVDDLLGVKEVSRQIQAFQDVQRALQRSSEQTAAGISRAYAEVSRSVGAQFRQREQDVASLNRFQAQAAQELNAQYGRSFSILSRGLSDITRQSRSTSTSMLNGLRSTFTNIQEGGGRAFSFLREGFSSVGGVARASASVAGSAISGVAGIASSLGSAFVGAGSAAFHAMHRASDAVRSLASHLGIASFQLQIMGSILTSLVTGPLVTAGVALGKWGLHTAMNIEDAQASLRALLPPGYDVAALFTRLQDLAVRSPVFAADQLFDFTRKLIGAGIEAGKAEKILDSLNKVFITHTVTGEKASKALLGVSQVFSKGKVNAEELTQQIGEQIPIWNLMAEATGKTQAELREMVFQGEISAEMFGDMLIQIGALPNITEGAARGVNTLSAQIAIMKDEFQLLLATEILKFFPDIKSSLDRLMPILKEFAQFIISRIPIVIDNMGRLVEKIIELKQRYDELSPGQKEMISKLIQLGIVAGPALLAIGSLVTALSSLLGFVSMLINPWGFLIGVLAGGFTLLATKSDAFRSGVDSFRESFRSTFGEQMPAAVDRLKAALDERLIPAFLRLLQALGFESFEAFGAWLGEKFALGAVAAIDGVTWAVLKLADGFEWLATKMPAIKQGLSDLIALAQRLKQKWDELDGGTKKVILGLAGSGAAVGLSGGLRGVLGSVAGGVVGLGTSLVGSGGLTTALRAVAHPAGIATLAVAGLGITLGIAALRSEELRDLGKDMAKEFKGGFSDSFERYAKPAIENFKGAFDDLTLALEDLAHALGFENLKEASRFFGAALGEMVAIFIEIGALYIKFVGFMVRVWAEGIREIKSRLRTAIGLINTALIKPWNWLMLVTGYRFGPPIAELQIPSALMDEPSDANRFATGGYVSGPGSATSDSILAMLSDGEFVMSAKAVDFWGANLLSAMNSGKGVPGFSNGGMANVKLAASTMMKYFRLMANNRLKYIQSGSTGTEGTSAIYNQAIAAINALPGMNNATARKLVSNLLEQGYFNVKELAGRDQSALDNVFSQLVYKLRAGLAPVFATPGTPPAPTLNSIPSLNGMNDTPASAGSGQDVYVTVYVGNELLVNQMQAVVDANNRAIINVARSVRTVV